MFDPDAYESVGRAFQKQRNIFVEILFDLKEAKERFVSGIKELIDRKELNNLERKRLRALLIGLFPQGSEAFSGGGDGEWDRDLRICHKKHFPKYFQLGAEPGDVSAAVVSKLLKPDTDRSACRELFQHVGKTGAVVSLFKRLRAIKEDIPKAQVEPIITALFDCSDDLPSLKAGLVFPSDADRELARIVAILLGRIEDAGQRAKILHRATLESSAITGPVLAVTFLEPRGEPQSASDEPRIDPKELHEIAKELLPRLWRVARSGGIWKLRMAAALIYRLRDWAGIEDVRQWVAKSIEDPQVAIAFLRIMLRQSHASGGGSGRIIYNLQGQHMEEFVDLVTLADHAESAAQTPLEKTAIAMLRKAIALKSAGKPYAEIHVLSFDDDGNPVNEPWAGVI